MCEEPSAQPLYARQHEKDLSRMRPHDSAARTQRPYGWADAGAVPQGIHDTRAGGTGWGAPGVVRVELRLTGKPTCERVPLSLSVAVRTIVLASRYEAP